jgi:lipopolysaccharide/colanic/teichoic acid biosynthesis glycosyltransferase
MDRWIKRGMDVVLATLGLILGAPLIALIALAVRLDSPGRAIFSQERLGQHGKVFRMHKFRKFPDSWGDRGSGVTVAGDARMTRLGRFLERSKFDEIPQLWNILKGEMSFVGPRPETLRFRDLFVGDLARVHDFLPGIFGPNQIAFRNESKMYPPDRDPEQFYREELFPRKARNDIAYFSQSNAFSDFLWILRGLWHSVAGAVDWRAQARVRGRALLVDLVLIQIAWIGANLVRFEKLPVGQHWDVFVTGAWLMPLVVLPVLAMGGGYRGAVRHFSVGDALRLGVSNVAGWTLAFLLLLALFERNAAMGLMPIALLFAVAMMGTARILYRERLGSDPDFGSKPPDNARGQTPVFPLKRGLTPTRSPPTPELPPRNTHGPNRKAPSPRAPPGGRRFGAAALGPPAAREQPRVVVRAVGRAGRGVGAPLGRAAAARADAAQPGAAAGAGAVRAVAAGAGVGGGAVGVRAFGASRRDRALPGARAGVQLPVSCW